MCRKKFVVSVRVPAAAPKFFAHIETNLLCCFFKFRQQTIANNDFHMRHFYVEALSARTTKR